MVVKGELISLPLLPFLSVSGIVYLVAIREEFSLSRIDWFKVKLVLIVSSIERSNLANECLGMLIKLNSSVLLSFTMSESSISSL